VINLWTLCQVEVREFDYTEPGAASELPAVRDSFCLVAAGDKGNRSNRYEFRHRGTRRGRASSRETVVLEHSSIVIDRLIDR